MARPTKYKPEHDEQVYKMKADGKSDEYICAFFKFSRSTLSLWKTQHETFSDNYKKGVGDKVDDNVHDVKNALLKRALGCKVVEITVEEVEGQVEGQGAVTKTRTVTKELPPETAACMGYLNNKAPDEFKQRKAAEEEKDANDQSIEIVFIDAAADES